MPACLAIAFSTGRKRDRGVVETPESGYSTVAILIDTSDLHQRAGKDSKHRADPSRQSHCNHDVNCWSSRSIKPGTTTLAFFRVFNLEVGSCR